MKRFLVMSLLCVVLSNSAMSEELSGRVTNSQGQGVPYASVELITAKKWVSTDADGYYSIPFGLSGILGSCKLYHNNIHGAKITDGVLSFDMPRVGNAIISIYNTGGRKLKQINKRNLTKGRQNILLMDLLSGISSRSVLISRIAIGNKTETVRFIAPDVLTSYTSYSNKIITASNKNSLAKKLSITDSIIVRKRGYLAFIKPITNLNQSNYDIELQKAGVDLLFPHQAYILKDKKFNIYFNSVIFGGLSGLNFTVESGGKGFVDDRGWHFEASSSYTPFSVNVIAGLNGVKNSIESIRVAFVDRTNTSPQRLLIIGDSFTNMGIYPKQIKEILPNVILKGTRKIASQGGVVHEGRSGWAASTYATATSWGVSKYYSPFIAPAGVGGHSYKGNATFWKYVCYDSSNAREYRGFQTIAKGWKEGGEYLYDTNGYPKNPKEGDVVFDEDKGNVFVEYSGGTWNTMSPQPEWEVSFSKYMDRSEAAYMEDGVFKPADTYLIALGTNEFYWMSTYPTEQMLDKWVTNMNRIINSIREYDSKAPIILSMPLTSAERDGDEADRWRHILKMTIKRLLDEWDQPRAIARGIYVAPVMPNFDAVNNFSSDKLHPNETGFLTIAEMLAGFIQHVHNLRL